MVGVRKMGQGKFYKGNKNEDGIPHGYGIMIYNNGSICEANWINGKREGFGYFITKNGSDYFGPF